MDLVTLVTACALSVEPKLMRALIWHQSGGEPWAVSVRNEPMPRVYSSMQGAISEVRAASVANGIVRVGLAGLPLSPSKVNAAVFLPCLNVAIAAQRIARLADRCNRHRRRKTDRLFCAVAAYHGSWEQPDARFAEVVMASVAKGDAPNFDMPNDINVELLDIASEVPPRSNDSLVGSGSSSEEHKRAWSSGLFPSNPLQPASEPNQGPNDGRTAQDMQSSSVSNAAPSTASQHSTACSFQDRSIAGRNDWHRCSSHDLAGRRTDGDEPEWR
jgi:type IV secretion system protein VirB1